MKPEHRIRLGSQLCLALREDIEPLAPAVRRRGTRRLHIGAALPLFDTQVNEHDICWIAGETLGGKIKVRVFVSKRIELIFNTTYRLGKT